VGETDARDCRGDPWGFFLQEDELEGDFEVGRAHGGTKASSSSSVDAMAGVARRGGGRLAELSCGIARLTTCATRGGASAPRPLGGEIFSPPR